jgi:hypothetical protein
MPAAHTSVEDTADTDVRTFSSPGLGAGTADQVDPFHRTMRVFVPPSLVPTAHALEGPRAEAAWSTAEEAAGTGPFAGQKPSHAAAAGDTEPATDRATEATNGVRTFALMDSSSWISARRVARVMEKGALMAR